MFENGFINDHFEGFQYRKRYDSARNEDNIRKVKLEYLRFNTVNGMTVHVILLNVKGIGPKTLFQYRKRYDSARNSLIWPFLKYTILSFQYRKRYDSARNIQN